MRHFFRSYCFVLSLLLLSCHGFSEIDKSESLILRSSDGVVSVDLPSGWRAAPTGSLNEKAELEAQNLSDGLYLICLDENKADFTDMSFDKFSQVSLDSFLKTVSDASLSEGGTRDLFINGIPAKQTLVFGTVKGLKVGYVYTVLETSGYYHQLLGWALRSSFDKKKEGLFKVVNSFKMIHP